MSNSISNSNQPQYIIYKPHSDHLSQYPDTPPPQDEQIDDYRFYKPDSQRISSDTVSHNFTTETASAPVIYAQSQNIYPHSTVTVVSSSPTGGSSNPGCCSNFYDNQIKARWVNLTSFSVDVVNTVDKVLNSTSEIFSNIIVVRSVSDLVVGVFSNIVHICTLGVHEENLEDTNKKITKATSTLLTDPFQYVMSIVNPQATNYMSPEALQNDGWAGSIRNAIDSKAAKFYESENCFVKHVVSRICAASMILSVIGRIFDLALGLICAALSIVTLGKIEILHKKAMIGLASGPAIISDVLYTVQCVINPSSMKI